MRNLLILGGLVVAAFMAGWFTIEPDGDKTTIRINRSEIQEDAKHAFDRGRDLLDNKLRDGSSSQYAGQNNTDGSVSPYGNQLQYQYSPTQQAGNTSTSGDYDRYSR